MNWKNVIERAVWTWVQAFGAALIVVDVSTARDAALAGVAALVSFVKNVAAERLAALDA